MGSIARLKLFAQNLYSKHLLATNVITCGALLGVGDVVVQKIVHAQTDSDLPLDWHRTGRMITIGFCLGPFNHYWYLILDKIVTRHGLTGVFQKIIGDQLVAGPFFCVSFLSGSTILQGDGLAAAKHEVKEKFLPIYMVDWSFWPAAQFVNFNFVPSRFRVLYVSFATLLWNSFLSFMKHDYDVEDECEDCEDDDQKMNDVPG